MNSALTCEDPVLVIEHLDLYTAKGLAPKDDLDYYIPLGKAKVMRDGNDFTVLAALAMVQPCIDIAVEMGVSAEIIDLRSLDRAGIDWETIGASLAKTGAVIIVEQGAQGTSYGGGIADELQRRFCDLLDQPVKRITGGEAAPTISKVLDLAANASDDDVRRGYADVMRDAGLGQVAE
jgi:2-oxoisovalerate dehydrogenase E1 component